MNVKLTLLDTGYCRQLELFSRKGGRLKNVPFHAIAGLIEHPVHGRFLFDTGYSTRFFEATRAFPYSVYGKLTPVVTEEGQSVRAQLEAQRIAPDSIKGILISHFHADHIGGLRDFPQAQLYCFEQAYAHIRGKTGIAALREGYLPDLMPDDFEERVTFVDRTSPAPLPKAYHPYIEAYDLFGDQSLRLVDLNGHARGQFGVLLRDEVHGEVFLCADAAWSSVAYREHLLPHPFARLIMTDQKAYRENLHKLHQLSRNQSDLRILPTHCEEVWQACKGEFSWRS
ncbi:MBL fold metallo-hydrolase [Brevibacillus reuszeri]|uniref:Hydrolase glyoxylase n=1 Tax=Brevibacillus reuszeri TaxID=54915 RepID=A0A0K9YKT4_9BACL|nr:MBL fold metallo-hydrolase [Brevibacillus reuszeri]KNB69277.1 hydrolase glyoxylase [Brevibacillus reuszeri]MED1860223.1 MBL fold metallo-hydrolase [Brevibacillus reuszeri]GED71578.1 MBL fold metallo-hydrolase [Brevibacillus reuszeri]